ncbi:MAG: DISARM system helicase DrmA [Ignavibacteriota bacterium]
MTSAEVRSKLVESLELDLVGPRPGLGDANEILPQSPSRWYLTGFLVPIDAASSQKVDEDATEELDTAESGGVDDDEPPERGSARNRIFASSMGVSVLVPAGAKTLAVTVTWGDYEPRSGPESWLRVPHEHLVTLNLPAKTGNTRETAVPESKGLKVALLVRPVESAALEAGLAAGTRTVSVFLVNRRKPAPDEQKDKAFAFQSQLEIRGDVPLVARPDLRGLASDDWDDRIADLQYRDTGEYAVGHNVATEAILADGHCQAVRTCWVPTAEVERVAPAPIAGVELKMDALAALADFADAQAKLNPLVTEYRSWISAQTVPTLSAKRQETADGLQSKARVAADRIAQGIALLEDPQCLAAFQLANKVMATAARRRLGVMQGKPPASITPEWRPFQLAFLLMNLPGIARPLAEDRKVVDLLFFPTGGGKTEAYLGLAACTLVLRRMQNPGITSAGVSVLMRYTLRLLTLDQLGRAATLICALELERQNDAKLLGDWPFEIGLWVGRAATPNRMGRKGDNDRESARARTVAYLNDDRKPSPIPLEECPWCGTKFKPLSFKLLPNPDEPTDLRIRCVNRSCEFGREFSLPILAVDDPIYRRLPCFIIATVDKFAGLPWVGQVGAFFGRVNRYDARAGFFGPCDTAQGTAIPGGRLLPPDLVIQDELHLISGPLGTMVGLYETALEALSIRQVDGVAVKPKIIASTATVRRADSQIRALFNRATVDIFPPPGPDRRDSFFARTLPVSESPAREYAGIAAQGRSPKVVMLRVYMALLGASQKYFDRLKVKGQENPADPYMTLVGYYNALRELGGARRLIEDEVRNRLVGYSSRKRQGEAEGLFANRQIDYEPVELTSRESTARVSEAKRRLALPFGQDKAVHVAIATNMISVGLDITRLGLMVVFGQPKTSAEYIQATSRVGRAESRPGLVVTIYNVHKPRDRSHYERFEIYHETFYRSVEVTSVTPFSPRALDKGLAGTMVGLARHILPPMTPARGAAQILAERVRLDSVVDTLAERALGHSTLPPAEADILRRRVRERTLDLLDEWSKEAMELANVGVGLQYNPTEAGGAQPLLRDFLSPDLKNLPPNHRRMKFRANRSLRDVEPSVAVQVKTIDLQPVEEDEV